MTKQQIDLLAIGLIRDWLEETKNYPGPAQIIASLKLLEMHVLDGAHVQIYSHDNELVTMVVSKENGFDAHQYVGMNRDFPLAQALKIFLKKATKDLK